MSAGHPQLPRVPQSQPRECFRFGWLAAAAAFPGKALALAVVLAWLADRDRRSGVRLTRAALRRFSVSRDAAYDGLRRLEAAGLVHVWRAPGRAPHVILRDVSSTAGPEGGSGHSGAELQGWSR